MKSLHDYIASRNQPYEFRIKIVNTEPKGDVLSRIKNALDAYELHTVSSVKSLPIQEHREFPKWGPCEAWQFDAAVNYPTTPAQVAQVIRERAGINPEYVCVYGKQQAEQNEVFENYGKDHEGALLDDQELRDVSGAQDLVGEKRIQGLKSALIKELDTALKENEGNKTADAVTTDSLPQGTISPVGSKQNKILTPSKGNK